MSKEIEKIKMKTIYRCEFKFEREIRAVRSKNSIADFEDGFWINDNLKFTKGPDCKFWIPPSQILYVSKDSVNE